MSLTRLRNIDADVVREPLNIICELHQPGRLKAAATQIKYLCSWQAVHTCLNLQHSESALCHMPLTAAFGKHVGHSASGSICRV